MQCVSTAHNECSSLNLSIGYTRLWWRHCNADSRSALNTPFSTFHRMHFCIRVCIVWDLNSMFRSISLFIHFSTSLSLGALVRGPAKYKWWFASFETVFSLSLSLSPNCLNDKLLFSYCPHYSFYLHSGCAAQLHAHALANALTQLKKSDLNRLECTCGHKHTCIHKHYSDMSCISAYSFIGPFVKEAEKVLRAEKMRTCGKEKRVRVQESKRSRATVQKRKNETACTIWIVVFSNFCSHFQFIAREFFRLSINAYTIAFSDSFVLGFEMLKWIWLYWNIWLIISLSSLSSLKNSSTFVQQQIKRTESHWMHKYERYIANENAIESIEQCHYMWLLLSDTISIDLLNKFHVMSALRRSFFFIFSEQSCVAYLSQGICIATQRSIETLIFCRNWTQPIYSIIHSIEIFWPKNVHTHANIMCVLFRMCKRIYTINCVHSARILMWENSIN